jgi:uncharacterized protein
MSENTDALERGYDAFNSGDIDGVASIFDDGITWEGPNTDGVPMSGKNEGKDAVLGAIGRIGEAFESFSARADEMIEQGDTIVVLSHIEAKTRSGTEIKTPGVEIWRMSGGKANRVQSLTDTAQVKDALG